MVNLTSTFVEKVPTESHTVDNVIALVSKIDTVSQSAKRTAILDNICMRVDMSLYLRISRHSIWSINIFKVYGYTLLHMT